MNPTTLDTSNRYLNDLIVIADHAYQDGNLDSFDAVLATIERHFYGLSLIPSL